MSGIKRLVDLKRLFNLYYWESGGHMSGIDLIIPKIDKRVRKECLHPCMFLNVGN